MTPKQLELLENWRNKIEGIIYESEYTDLEYLIVNLLNASIVVTEERVREEERKRNSLIVVKAMVGVCSRTQPELSHKLNKIRLQILSNNQD